MKCLDCESERLHARGLCATHYVKRSRAKRLPARQPRPVSKINEPHIRWMFEEMANQNISINKLADKAGVSRTSIQKQKTRQNISLFDFKCVADVLGYEVHILAKEPKSDPQTTD